MAIRVNPTRMELTRLKKRLKTAVKGHKLLKDKRDEMVRQFMLYIRRNRELRAEVEEALGRDMKRVAVASARMGEADIGEALLSEAAGTVSVTVGERNIMGVTVPAFASQGGGQLTGLPYSFAFTSAELDGAVLDLADLMPKLIELAQVEKTCSMLADEIEKTRRRVNALEHVMIPETQQAIKFITMKLEDNERSNVTRLMKVKDMILKEQGAQS
ncbi:MAG TPA: V-type ATP synthase subunit D [Candidatus Merdivicinus intestinigallinarum]|nr:V-type ATP synthase subunit D [Candidatus Merdivicinus intestinigallinarum]